MSQIAKNPPLATRAVISVHTETLTNKRLEILALQTRRSKSFLANDAILRYLDEEETFVTDVQAGIADSEAGRTMTTEELKQSLQAYIDTVAKTQK